MTTVRIRPTGRAFIDGVPAVEQDVTPERAGELLAYQPAAFVLVEPPPDPDPAPAGKAAKRTGSDAGPSVSPAEGKE